MIETYQETKISGKEKIERRIVDILCRTLLKRFNKRHILCFGDSHRSVFNNIEGIKTINVGSGTAYNLKKNESSTKAGKKIKLELEQTNNDETLVLLAFGEIDCMEHVYKNVYRNQRDVTEVVKSIVENYVEFIEEITNMGYTCMVYGPAFSGKAFNSYGAIVERNKAVRLLNDWIKKKLEENKLAYHYDL